MEDTVESTLSDALTWIATTTATAVEEWPTDQGDSPLVGAPLSDVTGPDDSEGSYFLVRGFPDSLQALCHGYLQMYAATSSYISLDPYHTGGRLPMPANVTTSHDHVLLTQ